MSDPATERGSQPDTAGGECLSDADLALLRGSPEGVPEGLARHLVSCERCQRRALLGHDHPHKPAQPPSLRRAFAMVAIVLAMMGVFLYSVLMVFGLV